jgi:DNA-binding transcriptional LysR family regulator
MSIALDEDHHAAAPSAGAGGIAATGRCNNAPVPSWDDLRYLLALHRSGSLARAARTLRVDKTTVGRRLVALEEAMRARLVDRRPAGFVLTPEGLRAVDAAARMEATLAGLESEIASAGPAAAGAVRVTAPGWFSRHVIIPALPTFQERHPALELQLVTTNALLNMSQREADVAIRSVRPRQRSLVARRLGVLGSALYGARSYLERRGRPTTRKALSAHHLAAYDDRVTYLASFDWLARLGAPVAFRATDTLVLLDAVVAGVGLGVLPCYLGEDHAGLERLALGGVGQEEIWAVTQADVRRSPRVRVAIDWLADRFREEQARLLGPGVSAAG